MKIVYAAIMFTLLHTLVWFAANTQFISPEWKEKSLQVAVLTAVPATLCAYYGARFAYDALNNSVWASRFLAFGISYLVFPVLTYVLLGESMFTTKTMLCVGLSCTIIFVQVFL
jgi:hypothetical protein|tara:strand:+ start:990 stop:1331 length:342 start_codon:yes stop_codon:yes gene_type:complete